MNKLLEKLIIEKTSLMEQIKPLEEKIGLIDKQIEDIRISCPHLNFKTTETAINVFEDKLDLIIDECEDCGETFYR